MINDFYFCNKFFLIFYIDMKLFVTAFYGWKYANDSFTQGSTLKFVIKFFEWIAGLIRSLFGFS